MSLIKNLPHKILFYIGFLTVFIFLGLSYWQLSRYQEDSIIMDEINSNNIEKVIYADNLFYAYQKGLSQFSKVNISDKYDITFIKSWYLRSRVHNGESGYHLVNLYTINSTNNYFIVKNGWVPLDKNASRTFPYEEPSFIGRLIEYDIQGIGQDDIPGSEYLFRIDKSFIDPEVYLYTKKYLGIPIFVNIRDKHISFEHTHPPHEYILNEDKFELVNKVKRKFDEIILQENN